MARRQRSESSLQGPRQFATTHWSIVAAAGRSPSPSSRDALATLCNTYWYPLYAYVRRRGHDANEAQDLTQDFFARLLEKDALRVADRERGRFRSFLLAALNHFLAKEWRRLKAQKRGGGRPTLSFDLRSGEERYRQEPSHELTPEKIYERRWALTLLEQALARLREEHIAAGKGDLFEALKIGLAGQRGLPYADLARRLHISEGAIKVSVHRLRRRCRQLLREAIAQTVASADDVEQELRDLFVAIQT